MPARIPQNILTNTIHKLQNEIEIGAIYSHYKNPKNTYKVIGIAIQEATNEPCVIYQALYGNKFIFVRNTSSWLEKPLINGKPVPRFKKIP